MSQVPRDVVVRELKDRLRRLERADRTTGALVLPTAGPLDRLFPNDGLAAGTLIEWLGEHEGTGVATLALVAAASLLQETGALVVVDRKGEFYPPAAPAMGIPLERTILLRPQGFNDAFWALEQSLRCPAVRVAVAGFAKLNDRAFRRLQLAAEAGGGLGFLLRPIECRREPSWAGVRLLVRSFTTPPQANGRRLHVEVLHCRGGASGGAMEVELNHETGSLRLVSPLAGPTLPPRTAGI